MVEAWKIQCARDGKKAPFNAFWFFPHKHGKREKGVVCLIGITGVPGTGKTMICHMLNQSGFKCYSLAELGRSMGCITGDEASIQCLREKLDTKLYAIIEGHYSHLMYCTHVIILERDPEDLRKVYDSRGYGREKTEQNIEVQESGTIYSEALDLLPSVRIFTVKNKGWNREKLPEEILKILEPIYVK
jgi:adenylate kinase